MPSLSDQNSQKYHVALSFAGEDRAFVDQVARRLKDEYGLSVFYDRFEEVTLLGKDLYEHLSEVYRKSALYCAVFISQHYAAKAWPRLERRNAQSRDLINEDEYILPFRFDDTEIPGLRDAVGYIALAHRSPEEIGDLIAEKIRRKLPFPVVVEVVGNKVFRESGSDLVGVDFECLLSHSETGAKTLRKLYSLVSVKGDWQRAKTIEIDGVLLESESTTMMWRPVPVEPGAKLELRIRSVHDLDDRRDLESAFLLSLQFEVDGEKYKQVFPLQYEYLPLG